MGNHQSDVVFLNALTKYYAPNAKGAELFPKMKSGGNFEFVRHFALFNIWRYQKYLAPSKNAQLQGIFQNFGKASQSKWRTEFPPSGCNCNFSNRIGWPTFKQMSSPMAHDASRAAGANIASVAPH